MDNVDEVMSALESKGSTQTRKTYLNHGAPDAMFGVKVGDMKVIAKKIKGNHELACELYKTGNADAMYLAGIVADGEQMSKKLLDEWVKQASWYMISEYTVPWVAVESGHGRDLAIKWMKAKREATAAAGWATYSGLVATVPDEELDLDEISDLLTGIPQRIESAQNRVRYGMNGFVISVGGYVKPLNKLAKSVAKKIGAVHVDMGNTACKVPLATDYIAKMEKSPKAFQKKKTIKC